MSIGTLPNTWFKPTVMLPHVVVVAAVNFYVNDGYQSLLTLQYATKRPAWHCTAHQHTQAVCLQHWSMW